MEVENEIAHNGAIETISDTIGDLVTGIPATIRKNLYKVLNRFVTACGEYPVTLLEGAIAERRAESKARVELIKATSDQISKQMMIKPEYVRAAADKFSQKIIRKQINIDQISAIALDELKSQKHLLKDDEIEPSPISDDWLNAFESEATQMSSEQMQKLFGKILAGEIQRPSSYSIKTVKLLAQLDNLAAILFTTLCSLSVSLRLGDHLIQDARVVSLGDASSNTLQSFGLGFDQLNILQEYGLIIANYNSYMDYQFSIVRDGAAFLPMKYQNADWALIPKEGITIQQDLKITGVAFSKSGKELLSIVDVIPNNAYDLVLKNHFENLGFSMLKI